MSNFKLTDREKQIAELILKENTSGEISQLLRISEKTVETHRKNIYLKTGSKTLVGLVKNMLKYKENS
ncbi:MAG: helix-turn-helix transcriptional regulator [Cyclobacteriaceae bacterium]